MCRDCGCSQPLAPDHRPEYTVTGPLFNIPVQTSLHAHNDALAAALRQRFDKANVVVLNLMSSPGAGKTRLLEATLQHLGNRVRCAVLEGDLETDLDALRIQALGIPAVQITTGTACHLDAAHIEKALESLDLGQLDLLLIENVGNLVCPASFDLGQHANVILLATTEGDDKPVKYPVMFHSADLVLINKIDLLPHLPDFSLARARESIQRVAGDTPVLEVAAATGKGIGAWLNWLEGRYQQGFEDPGPPHDTEPSHAPV